MKRIFIFMLLASPDIITMENPDTFARNEQSAHEERKRCLIIPPANPPIQALQLLESLKMDPHAECRFISCSNIHNCFDNSGIATSNCGRTLANEALLMAPAVATTACCLSVTQNLSWPQSVAAGCGSYFLTVLCLSDENESLSRETYSGQAALYLKRRLKASTISLLKSVASHKSSKKDS